MLTDIFSNRYCDKVIFPQFREPQRRLLMQSYRLISDDLPARSRDDFWEDLNRRMSTELGLINLSAPQHPYFNQHKTLNTKPMCQAWLIAAKQTKETDDEYLKERMSFVELAFRQQETLVGAAERLVRDQTEKNAATLSVVSQVDALARALAVPGPMQNFQTNASKDRAAFDQAVRELNVRLQQAGAGLHYHNGFLQISGDLLTAQQIEEPFWSAVADGKWANVDLDMKEAVDARDTGGRDPAWFAARALESTIKIISNERRLSTGKERGAQNYIENIMRGEVIAQWEQEQLKLFFTHVRNDFGHGPGDKPMPQLPAAQTDWAIEFCMSWIKQLVRRHEPSSASSA